MPWEHFGHLALRQGCSAEDFVPFDLLPCRRGTNLGEGMDGFAAAAAADDDDDDDECDDDDDDDDDDGKHWKVCGRNVQMTCSCYISDFRT